MINLDDFSNICIIADKAGKAAVEKVVTRSVLVYEETHPFSGVMDVNKPTYILDDYPCGFAWVNVYLKSRSNSIIGKQERRVLEACGFKKDFDSNKRYYLWVSAYNQSMQKKEAYANAYAKVLRENGIDAYSASRMD